MADELTKELMAITSGKRARKGTSDEQNYAVEFKEVRPLNYVQESYLNAIAHNEIIFGVGCAGTGKTFVSASYAASQLYHKRIERIILTRPNVEIGRGLGFLPGSLDEKYAPYLDPFESVFVKTLGQGFYEYCIKHKRIDPKPLGFMRGVTFDDCIVLVDEAQNVTKQEFMMLLSRIGKNCKMILSGDPDQCDINNSGLLDAVNRLGHLDGIDVVRFLANDIVRSKICKQVIMAYRG